MQKIKLLLPTVIFAALSVMVALWLLYAVRNVILWGSMVRAVMLILAVVAAWAILRLIPKYRGRMREALQDRRRVWRWGAVWLVLAVGLRGLALVAGHPQLRSDPAAYAALGHDLARGAPYELQWDWIPYPLRSSHPPGLPFLIAANYLVFGDSGAVPWLANLEAGVLLVGGAAAVAGVIAGAEGGLVVLAVMALLPLNVIWVWGGYSEVPFGAFLFGAIAVVAAGTRSQRPVRSGLLALAGGVLLGCSSLARPQALLCTPLLLLLALGGRTSRLVRPAALLVGLALTLAPWAVRNYEVQGHRFVLISTNGGAVLFSANGMHGDPHLGGAYQPDNYRALVSRCHDEIECDRLGYQLGKQEIRQNWGLFLRSLVYRYDTMWSVALGPLGMVTLGPGRERILTALLLVSYWFIPVLFLLSWRQIYQLLRRSGAAQVMAAAYVMYMIAVIPFEVQERSHYPLLLVPLLLALVALLCAAPTAGDPVASSTPAPEPGGPQDETA
jgi:4-amino-4-deoxy-L-arabinose transferase-like glycosyltransferase